MFKKVFFLVVIILAIATHTPGWALMHDGGKSPNPPQEWQPRATVTGEKIYIRPVNIYPTTIVHEDAKTKPCPSKFSGHVQNYKNDPRGVQGDGTVSPEKDRRPVSKWEQSILDGRRAEAQRRRDAGQDEAIAGKLESKEFDEYTNSQAGLDRDQNSAILANTRAISGVWYWVAGILFVAGLALTILFLALRWYWAGGIAGAICFIGLLALAILYFGLVGIAIVALIGLIAVGVILWYVYPSFQGSPVPIPPPRMGGGGPVAVSRPAV